MTTAPTITIYVRHSADCKHSGNEFHKGCKCRKWLRWTPLGQKRKRKPAKTRSWDEAESVKRALADSLEGKTPAADKQAAKLISDAITVFLTSKGVSDIGEDTVGKYTRELERLRTFAERKGIYTVDGLTVELLTAYMHNWKDLYPSSQTRSVVRTRCRGFLRFCYEAQWIPRIPSLPTITVDEVPTMPLADDEYNRLLVAADEFKAPPPAKVVRALILLMRWSGLSIRDALTLPTARLTHTKGKYRVMTNRQKTGTHVSVLLPPDIGREILAVAVGDYLFWDGSEDIVKSWTKYVIAPLFKAAKIEKGGSMMSHRLRDTFACDLLSKGVPLEEVSKLLGHASIKTTEKSYSKWVKTRQDRLDTLVEASWG